MIRPDTKELINYLQCPYCKGELHFGTGSEISCMDCNKGFGLFRGRPVLLRDENELFPASEYLESPSTGNKGKKRKGFIPLVKSLVPSRFVNVARERMFTHLATDHAGMNKQILVVGCGNQSEQLNRHFNDDTTFIFCDIDKQADAELFCDAHELAFKDGMFDGVISTAVFEHVLYPEKVIEEMHRVIKHDGFIYSEIPFLQGVHEGAYDFTRFTMSGHRRLCEQFNEIEAGMVAGPGTALVWSIVDFSRSLFVSSRLSSLAALTSRAIFFWLKYFDYLCKDNPNALDAASCTYFYGNRRTGRIPADTIIDRYHGRDFKHT